ncbi:MAG TPA: methyltransferase, partial [Candidatus Binatia bacterium]|nr:methyltransferase [Candidatus Binatia bacterium]
AGYPATLVEFEHASVRIALYQVAGLENLVDREALLREDLVPEPPYWAHLWIGARALARNLAEAGSLSGTSVLDLGCGLGLTGLVAAGLGAEVWCVDREAAALEFVRESARRNRLEHVHCVELDFVAGALGRRFDIILGAEIVYDPQSYAPLCDFLEQHLGPKGVLHLTDAFRSDAESFFAELRRRGFEGRRRSWREWEEGRPQGLFLWTFWRAG